MAQVELKYTLPYQSSGSVPGANVDITLTYDENSPIGVNSSGDPYFEATAASGTYEVLGAGNTVTETDSITGIEQPGSQGSNDNYITPSANPIILNSSGVTFSVSNASGGGYGNGLTNVFKSGPTLEQDGSNGQSAINLSSNPGCFTSGTAVRVHRNGVDTDVLVEDLRVGDLAVTASGHHRPIRWIGSRLVHCRHHASPEAVMPVRIRAGALGVGKPARDLVVSPGHGIALDMLGEVLIPAIALLNGSTVVQEDVDTVTYWHVELDDHDLLLSEGQPAESFLDMGNRVFFASTTDRGVLVDLSASPDGEPASRTHDDFCRPFHGEGPVASVAREQLKRRAATLGWHLSGAHPWAGAYLVADGRRIDPEVRGLAARFQAPAGARELWLVSPVATPRDLGINGDPRRLGLNLRELRVDDGWESCPLPLDDSRLSVGFHALEGASGALRRWTNGRARLPASLWSSEQRTLIVHLEQECPALPHWVGPATDHGANAGEACTMAA